MPPGRRRQRAQEPALVIEAALRALLADIASHETAEQRARAATGHIAALEAAKRTVAEEREAAVAEMLRGRMTLRATARALGLSVNAVVQIRDQRLGRPRHGRRRREGG